MDSSSDGLGIRQVSFKEEEKMREVLSKSNSWDAEGSDRDK